MGGSLQGTNPKLDPAGLRNNGGPTKTIGLRWNSPALDFIANGDNGCGTTYTTDQRGISRPQNTGCDSGAFESDQPPCTGVYRALIVQADCGVAPNTLRNNLLAQPGITAVDLYDAQANPPPTPRPAPA